MPFTVSFNKAFIPNAVIILSISVNAIVPKMIPIILPLPPDSDKPPMTTAEMAYSTKLFHDVAGSKDVSLAIFRNAAIPVSAPHMTNILILVATTPTPASIAAFSLLPSA